jgi:xanthine dehydrogenase accessory factor
MTGRLSPRIAELLSHRVPFVHATVVRAQLPSSARPGDDAIVLPDGSIEGFVGGQCAEGSVRAAALGALADGESVLLRVLPADEEGFPDSPGAQVVVNPCLSGGALEIFLQPLLPDPVLWLVGETPVAEAVLQLAGPLGLQVARAENGTGPTGATAAILASHGRGEIEAIQAALDAGVGFVGLVASHRRAAGVLAELGLSEQERARVHAPAGLAIGARTAPEIALAILAEVVQAIRTGKLQAAPAPDTSVAPSTALDPVCGMTVLIGADTPHLVLDGQEFWFCNPGCRNAFAAERGVAADCS